MADNLVLTIYSIPGISCVDEPIFDNIADQENFFYSQDSVDIEHSYFPPFYTNVIKVDRDDLPVDIFTSNYNYLSIVYEDKTYYYFITEIVYINESIVALRLDLDDIQTYMFSATIISGLIERMSIKRYVRFGSEYYINRDYLRENLSLGVFQTISVKVYNEPSNWSESHGGGTNYYTGCFIVKSKKHTNEGVIPDHEDVIYHLSNPERVLPFQGLSGYNTAIIPMSQGELVRNGKIGAYDSSLQNSNFVLTLMHFALNDANSIYIYYLPFASAGDIAFTADDTCRYDEDSFDLMTATPGGMYLTPKNQGVYDLTTYIDAYNFEDSMFYRNPSRLVNFGISYVPYLLDEQYISITFGENTTMSSFPIHKLKKLSILLKYIGEPNSGSRIYWVTVPDVSYIDDFDFDNYSGANLGIDDYLGTVTVAANKILFDISTSSYVEWLAYNKASIPLDLLGSLIRAV